MDKRTIIAYDDWGGSKIYASISEASADTGVPPSAICKCCQGSYKSTYGYSFKYYDSDDEIECDDVREFRKHNVEAHRRKRELKDSDKLIVAVDITNGKYRLYDSFSFMCRELMLNERNAYRVLSHDRYHKSVGGYTLWRYNEVLLSDLNGPF